MSFERSRQLLNGFNGLTLQPAFTDAEATPCWGLVDEAADGLSNGCRERLKALIHLREEGDTVKPEMSIIRLRPEEWFRVRGRWVRAVKVKGVSRRILPIRRGEARHMRLLGRGDLPLLAPYLTPQGEERFVEFEVGEPFGAKRFRGVANEMSITCAVFRQGLTHICQHNKNHLKEQQVIIQKIPVWHYKVTIL